MVSINLASFEGKYPKDLFNKSVYTDDKQILLGYVAKEVHDLIVVFSESYKDLRFDIPKSEIAVDGSSVIIQNSQSVLSSYKVKKDAAFPERKSLKLPYEEEYVRAEKIARRQKKTLTLRKGWIEPFKPSIIIMHNLIVGTIWNIFKSKKNHFSTLLHLQSRKRGNESQAKSVRTWVEGINDESNLWLKAVILNDKGNFIDAILLYLEDANYRLKEGLMTHAALSCSCAANCMTKIGQLEEARRLYAEAARIYSENANKVIGESIREGLWLLQEAYENYSLALDEQNAKQVYDWYVSIASRISPFYNLNEKLEILGFRKRSIREDEYSDIKVCPLTREAKKAVDDFFLVRAQYLKV
jgi:tetratricopeptide (TPR) repeat protein